MVWRPPPRNGFCDRCRDRQYLFWTLVPCPLFCIYTGCWSSLPSRDQSTRHHLAFVTVRYAETSRRGMSARRTASTLATGDLPIWLNEKRNRQLRATWRAAYGLAWFSEPGSRRRYGPGRPVAREQNP